MSQLPVWSKICNLWKLVLCDDKKSKLLLSHNCYLCICKQKFHEVRNARIKKEKSEIKFEIYEVCNGFPHPPLCSTISSFLYSLFLLLQFQWQPWTKMSWEPRTIFCCWFVLISPTCWLFFFCLLKKLKTIPTRAICGVLWGFEKKPKLCIPCLWDSDLRYIAEVLLGLRSYFSHQRQLYWKNKCLAMISWNNCSWRSYINM